MRIAVLGAGGLGAYFGGRWAQAGLDVTFLARGAQLAALVDAPLAISSPLGDATVRVAAVGDPERIGPVDVVMVATKTWQLPSAAERIGPLLGPDTVVFGVQNGVEAGDALAAAVGAERVLDGTCRIISYVAAPGSVVHVGVQPTLTFGERAGGVSSRAERLLGTLERGIGMTVHLSAEIVVELWKKFFFFAPVSALGALAQVPVGEWRRLPEPRGLFAGGLREVQALAAARDVALPADAVETALEFLDRLPPDGSSSLQRDIHDGRRTELDALAGAVVRLAREARLATPIHAMLYSLLLPRELLARAAAPLPGE